MLAIKDAALGHNLVYRNSNFIKSNLEVKKCKWNFPNGSCDSLIIASDYSQLGLFLE